MIVKFMLIRFVSFLQRTAFLAAGEWIPMAGKTCFYFFVWLVWKSSEHITVNIRLIKYIQELCGIISLMSK